MADKYTDDDRKAMASAGQAMPDGSYPIKDAEDLDNAIRAVGRGGADHDAIRRHITARAKALGLSSKIPDGWSADGSLKGATASSAPLELRRRRGSMFGRPERRRASCEFELRAMPDGTGGSLYELNFYASTFNDLFGMYDQWGDPYDEVVRDEAFTQTLARPDLDTSLLLGHNDAGLPYARTTNGKVRMAQDSQGLHVGAQRLNGARSDVRDMVIAVQDGDLSEASIGFVTRKQKWSADWSVREMLELDLHRGDVSLVTFGANPATKGATAIAMPGESAWSASWQPAVQSRAQGEITDLSTSPDFNLSANGHGALKCPYTKANGCGQMNAATNQFCGHCGGPLYDSDGSIVLDDSGVTEEVGASGDADLLSRRLRLLELA